MPETRTDLLSGVPDESVNAFTDEVRAALLKGDRHTTPGFGTFTTCTRKAAPGRPACTIAMFRASKELRAHVVDGAAPVVSGPHCVAVGAIVEAMQREHGVDVPRLGHLAAVRTGKKKPRLIFRADTEFNDALTAGAG